MLKNLFKKPVVLLASIAVLAPCLVNSMSRKNLEELIKKKFPGRDIHVEKFSIEPYAVVSIDGRFFMVDTKNGLVFPGAFSLKEGKDLLKPYKERYISRISRTLDLKNFIHYTKKPKKGVKRLLLFTDPKCPFCKRVFAMLKEKANSGDIDLYLGFIPVHRNVKQVEGILCSKDPAFTYARIVEGKKENLKPCKEGAKRLMKMIISARKAGYGSIWRGVPTVIGLDGEGYVVGANKKEIEKLLRKKSGKKI